MKKVLMLFAVMLLSLPSFASSQYDTKGDDLFPWPWGSECPFPWKEINGRYRVQAKGSGIYSRHYLVFEVSEGFSEGIKFIKIWQFDSEGALYAEGRGYSKNDQRVVRGLLAEVETGKEYSVIVRSYERDSKNTCLNGDLVTAVTFCPLRGKKCLEDSNYVLEKMKSP